LIDGPTFRNSPFWNVHIQWSKDITVRNVLITNDLWAQNGDGIGFDSCSDVLFENSKVFAGDDNISCKSGKDLLERKRHIPTENVTIRNCLAGWGHGGFVLGSETSGDIRNIHIIDCACVGTDVGLRFKSVRGRGGVVEDVHVENLKLSNIQKNAILFDMYYEVDNSPPEPLSERTPCFKNFDLKNITCTSAKQTILMRGLAELPISDITFENMNLAGTTGASFSQVRGVTLRNVHIESKKAPAYSASDAWNLTLDHVDAIVNPKVPATQPSEPTP
jgi:polygalacturonase